MVHYLAIQKLISSPESNQDYYITNNKAAVKANLYLK